VEGRAECADEVGRVSACERCYTSRGVIEEGKRSSSPGGGGGGGGGATVGEKKSFLVFRGQGLGCVKIWKLRV
jgi:hypothetical protein